MSRLTVCLVVVLICIGTSSWAAQSGSEKVVFSIPSRSIAAVDLYIAKERGFFREEGLDVDIVQIRGNVAIAAALSGRAGTGKVVAVVSGGNIDLSRFAELVGAGAI